MTKESEKAIAIHNEIVEPIISIIMPVYNKASYIEDTISSILNQTYSSYEVIMVGGASTDDSDVICQKYANANPNTFKYISQTGKGVSTARNDGILVAKGKYIAFLDADDIWIPEYLETMKNLIDDYPEAVFYAGGHTWKYPDALEINRVLPIPRGYIDYFKTIMDYNGLGILTSWIVYNRNTLLDVGTFKVDFIIGEDVDLSIRMALSGKVAYEPKNLGIYRAELPGSLCKYSNGFAVGIPGEREILNSVKTPILINFYEWWAINTALQNIVRGFPKTARKQLKECNLSKKKILLLFFSYLPTIVASNLHQTYNSLIWRKTDSK